MLAIGEFSKICNVTTKTLRYYDEINLVKPIKIDENSGYRFYDVSQLKDMLLIEKLKRYNFTLGEIGVYLNGSVEESYIMTKLIEKKLEILNQLDEMNSVVSLIDDDILNIERGRDIMSYLEDIKVEIVEVDDLNIYYIRDKINIVDFGMHLQKLYEGLMKEGLTPIGGPMTIYHDSEFKPEDYDVEMAIPVKEVTDKTRVIKGGLRAKSILKGSYENLTSIYSNLNEWIEKENYKITLSPYEVYVTDPNTVAVEDNITEVYYPISK